MKTFLQLTRIAFIVLTFVIVHSCGANDDDGSIQIEETNTIADFVSSNDDYSSLLAALQKTGLDVVFAEEGDFTVFAPNNAAFDTFLNGTSLEDVDNNVLVPILLNHVLSTSRVASSFDTGYEKNLATEVSSGANIDLYIDTTNGVVINGESTVTSSDIITDNGIIHAVNSVIPIATLETFISLDPNFSLGLEALTDEGNTAFTSLLSDTDQDITIFYPSNSAITTLLDGATIADINNSVLEQILSNHIITGSVGVSTNLSNGYLNTNALFNDDMNSPLSLYVNTNNGITLNGIAEVDLDNANIVASNGVLHVVESVITLPNVVTFALADPNFSALVSALTQDVTFNYVDILQSPTMAAGAPFTVFAPVNTAFENLLEDLGINELTEIETTVLSATLDLHVLSGVNVRESDLLSLDGTMPATIGGIPITIQADPGAIIDPDGNVNNIIVTDVQAANGVIHAVDRVLRDL